MSEPITDTGREPTTPPVRVGVVGCADVALRHMLPAFAGGQQTELVAVASRDARRAREVADRYGCRAVGDYAELLTLDEVDAVYVSLPTAQHAYWAEAALQAGKHVLVEKPLAMEPGRARELLDLATRSELVLMENVMFVHHPQHAAVRKRVADGEIGELRSFRADFAVPELPADDLRYRSDLGGGALFDVGLFPVRGALHMLGSGLRVAGAVLRRTAGHSVETSGAALLESPDGVLVQLTFGMGFAYRSSYELWGSRGRIRVEQVFTPRGDHPPVLQVELPASIRPVVLDPDDQVAGTVRAFVEAVRAGTPGAPDAELCLEQAVLLDEIRRLAGTARGPLADPS